ncbi:LytR/AlgR family response regulator transcription factor [Alloscardovia sp. HMSC034E08]|uniref:LytR/AlgR family response regulator transcription factor n=1 Tax=Alloscardovia sp. HMSC034E08 TaxID=1739413 RepID=UPI0008D54CF6|nr:LytTR family DNA-binding domain-containing protein [Alloscardovia sp. HMSC034E08]OFQ97523.1 hypothetical protein HMPREF2909_02850 [Alloscardovia sp. HMSC034E08]
MTDETNSLSRSISIALVEDEKPFQDMLSRYIEQYAHEFQLPLNIHIFSNGPEFLDSFHNQYDLVLLDVVMPGMTGFDVAHTIRENKSTVSIVFITSMVQYAIRGYEVGAVDYILKPLEYELFRNKFKRILSNVRVDSRFALESAGKIIYVDLADITYIESDKHYALWHGVSGGMRTRHTIRSLATQLESRGFALARTSLLVNLNYVVRATADTVWVAQPTATDPRHSEALPIARAYRTSLRDRLTQFYCKK